MKFSCPNCGKAYVTDDAMIGRAFEMTCKKCGQKIVRGPARASSAPGSAPAASAPRAPGSQAIAADIWAELKEELGDAERAGPPAAKRPGAAPGAVAEAVGRAMAKVRAEHEPQPTTTTASFVPPAPPEDPAAPAAAPARRRIGVPNLVVVALLAGSAGSAVAWKVFPQARRPAAEATLPVATVADPLPEPAPPAEPASAAPEQGPDDAAASGAGSRREDRGAYARASRPVRRPEAPERFRVRKPGASAPAPREPERPAPAAAQPKPAPRVAMVQASPPPGPAPAEVAPASPGPFDERAAEASLTRAGAAFETCLSTARQAEPKLALEWEWLPVPVTMVLGPGGKALAAVIEDADLNRSELGRCIRKACEATGYPTFAGEPVQLRTFIHLHDASANTHNTRRRGI